MRVRPKPLVPLLMVLVLPCLAACGGGGGGGSNAAARLVLRAGGSDYDKATSVTCHNDGSLTVVGAFQGAATFGAGTPSAVTLVAGGNSDVFVARYDAQKTLLWVQHGVSSSFAEATTVALGPDGSCIVGGSFSGQLTFASTNGVTTLGSDGPTYPDAFVVVIFADGSVGWAHRIAGPLAQFVSGVSVAPDGSAYVVGNMQGATAFAPGTSGEINLSTFAGSGDVFLARYGPNGALQWAKIAGGNGLDTSRALVAHPAGGAVVVGHFNGSAVFGFLEQNATTLTSQGASDGFVARYASDGTLTWAQRIGSAQGVQPRAVDLLSDGSIALAAACSGQVTFAPGTLQQALIPAVGGLDTCVARYQEDGTFLWARRAGGSLSVLAQGLSVGAGNAIYVAGNFSGNATFGANQPNPVTLNTSSQSMWVANITQDGVVVWVRATGGPGIVQGSGAAHTPSGGVVVVGTFEDSVTWGAPAPTTAQLTSVGSGDAYAVRYDSLGFLE